MTSSIPELLADYISLRRSLGYRHAGTERYLRSFVRWLDHHDHHQGPIPHELSIGWASETASSDPATPAWRLTAIRGFLRHVSGLDDTTDVPPPGVLGPTSHRKPPHVYSDQEISDLLAAAMHLSGTLRPLCYYTIFGLMACTGMRIGETLALHHGDVDLQAGIITVRFSKRGRVRFVPVHPSAVQPLRNYATRRAQLYGIPASTDTFFRTDRSTHISYNTAQHAFSQLRDQLGWTAVGRIRLPRIHDLRHRMVIRRIQHWYTTGADLDTKIPVLATYLGHTEIANVYWYVSAVPELMSIVADRFETFAQQQTQEDQ